jgi:hypothetical protein
MMQQLGFHMIGRNAQREDQILSCGLAPMPVIVSSPFAGQGIATELKLGDWLELTVQAADGCSRRS